MKGNKMEFKNDICKVNVTFRHYQKADYEGFINCIREFYGDSYPHDEYLQKESIESKIDRQKMFIICGVTDKEEIISVSGADFDCDFEGTCLLTLRVVKKCYRKMGIGDYQENILLEELKKAKGICSIYVELMQNNGSSQGVLHQKGFINTGLRLAQYGNQKLLKALNTSTDYRTSAVVMCKNAGVKDVGILYCPDNLTSFVKNIYDELNTSTQILNEQNRIKKVKDLIQVHEYPSDGCVNLFVDVIGKDFERNLSYLLKLHTKDVFVCYLNMKDEASCSAYEKLIERGFFFTGIKPLNKESEYMMLARLDKKQIDENGFSPDSLGKTMLDKLLRMQ